MKKTLVILVICLLLGCKPTPYEFHGPTYDLPHPAPDFSLTAVDGSTYHLADKHERLEILYFGYTTCPDICPTTLATFATLRKQLDPKAPVDMVFLSIDPVHDTPAAVKAYIANFDSSIIGISADSSTIQALLAQYGGLVEYTKDNIVQSHSDDVYLIDQAGNWLAQYHYPLALNDILPDIKHLLENPQ